MLEVVLVTTAASLPFTIRRHAFGTLLIIGVTRVESTLSVKMKQYRILKVAHAKNKYLSSYNFQNT